MRLHILEGLLLGHLLGNTSLALSYAGSPAAQNESSCESTRNYDLGRYTFPISSPVPRVKELFNEGVNWTYSFNHGEAERAFRDATKIDPDCAICYWGIAYVLGPNINAPMSAEAAPKAYQALASAQEKIEQASPLEKAFIEALSQRYTAQAPSDRAALDLSYAKAMRNLAEKYPDNSDVLTLAAEAQMDVSPWNYWTADREPKEETKWIIDSLQKVLKKNPLHPGANHYLIHIAEAVRPELAEEAADRLMNLVPASGHMQHMPSHIYIRVGRYHDGSISNQIALKADLDYLADCHVVSFYEMMYVAHNYEFLVATASLEGRGDLAISTAYELREYITPHLLHSESMYDMQQAWANPYWALARFKQWDRLLAEPAPKPSWPYANAVWHYTRTLAFANKGALHEAEAELSKLQALAKSPSFKTSLLAGLNSAASIMGIGVEEAKGVLAIAKKDPVQGILHLERAIKQQDSLVYIEPPAWYQSVRLTLGAALLKIQQPGRAEKVYREDLKNFPDNGWALAGLYESLTKQSFVSEAKDVQAKLKKAWQYADTNVSQQSN